MDSNSENSPTNPWRPRIITHKQRLFAAPVLDDGLTFKRYEIPEAGTHAHLAYISGVIASGLKNNQPVAFFINLLLHFNGFLLYKNTDGKEPFNVFGSVEDTMTKLYTSYCARMVEKTVIPLCLN